MSELTELLNYLKVCTPYRERYEDIKIVEKTIKILNKSKMDPFYVTKYNDMKLDHHAIPDKDEYFIHLTGQDDLEYFISNKGNVRSYFGNIIAEDKYGNVILRISKNPNKFRKVKLKDIIKENSHRFKGESYKIGASAGFLY